MLTLTLLALFIGAVGIGFVSAIAGIGGGSLMIPFMVLMFNYDIRVAIATSLLCIVITSSTAASEYLMKGLVDLRTALLLEPATAFGAVAGAYVSLALPIKVLRTVLGLLLLYISVTMLKDVLSNAVRKALTTKVLAKRKALGIPASFLAGLTSGMLGIGGGVMKVPLMTLILKLPIKVAVATSSFMISLTAASGGAVYLMRGYTDPVSVVALALGIIPGATLGARYLGRLKPQVVKLIFSFILLYASVRLIYSVIT